jgi:hypothetical protein
MLGKKSSQNMQQKSKSDANPKISTALLNHITF